MAIGFLIPSSESYVSSDTQIRPDRGIRKASKPRIRTAKFGDGYEQRLVDGINAIEEQYSVSFNNRPKADIDDIVKFFDTRVAASFNFTIPDTNNSGETTIKVVCNSYNTTYNNDTTYSCSATFRRVYEA